MTDKAHDITLLSAYIDGELDEHERQSLEARLGTDADLQAELASLEQTVQLVRQMPLLKAPRNYTLDPALFGRGTSPPAIRKRQRGRILSFNTRSLGAIAAVFVVAVFAVYLITQGSPREQSNDVAQESGAFDERTQAQTDAASAPENTATALAPSVAATRAVEVAEVASPTVMPTSLPTFSNAPDQAESFPQSQGAQGGIEVGSVNEQPPAPAPTFEPSSEAVTATRGANGDVDGDDSGTFDFADLGSGADVGEDPNSITNFGFAGEVAASENDDTAIAQQGGAAPASAGAAEPNVERTENEPSEIASETQDDGFAAADAEAPSDEAAQGIEASTDDAFEEEAMSEAVEEIDSTTATGQRPDIEDAAAPQPPSVVDNSAPNSAAVEGRLTFGTLQSRIHALIDILRRALGF